MGRRTESSLRQLTVYGVDDDLERRLRILACADDISLDEVVLRLLRRGVGLPSLTTRDVIADTLDHLAYGALPSDVAMTAWMPDRHLRTGRVVTSHLSPAAAACQPILTTLVHAYDARIVEDGREAVALQGAQRVYARGPFPVRLADLTYRISLDPFACWRVARSSETESSNPAPTELVLVGRSDDLQSIPLPTEWGAQSWRRWLWLPAAPAIDVAGFVIVPLEWMVAVVRSWTTPSDRGPGAES